MNRLLLLIPIIITISSCGDVTEMQRNRSEYNKLKEEQQELWDEIEERNKKNDIVTEEIFLKYRFDMDSIAYDKHTTDLLAKKTLTKRNSSITYVLEIEDQTYECINFKPVFSEYTSNLSILDFDVLPITTSVDITQSAKFLRGVIEEKYQARFSILHEDSCSASMFYGSNLYLNISCFDEDLIKIHYSDNRNFDIEQSITDSLKALKREKAVEVF